MISLGFGRRFADTDGYPADPSERARLRDAARDRRLRSTLHAGSDLLAYEAGARTTDLDRYEQVLTFEGPNMYFGGVNAVRRTP